MMYMTRRQISVLSIYVYMYTVYRRSNSIQKIQQSIEKLQRSFLTGVGFTISRRCCIFYSGAEVKPLVLGL